MFRCNSERVWRRSSRSKLNDWKFTKINCTSYGLSACREYFCWGHYLLCKMTEKEKKELENLIKKNGYNEELQDIYLREVLDVDKEFDDNFDIDWEV